MPLKTNQIRHTLNLQHPLARYCVSAVPMRDDKVIYDLVSKKFGSLLSSPTVVNSIWGPALKLDGVDDAIVIPTSTFNSNLSELTIVMWVRTDTYVASSTYATKGLSGWLAYQTGTNRTALFRQNGTGFVQAETNNSAVVTGNWEIWVWTTNGTRFASGISFYKNHGQATQGNNFPFDATSYTPSDSANDIRLGLRIDGTNPAQISIAAFALFNKNLTFAGDLYALFNSSDSLFYPQSNNYVKKSGLYVSSVIANPGLTASVSDELSFSDSVITDGPLIASVSDSFSLSDGIQSLYEIYVEPISIQVADDYFLRDGESIFQPDDSSTVQIVDALVFEDEAIGAEVYTASFSDEIAFSDALEVFQAGAIECYDTLQYNWNDEVKVSLEQGVDITDSLSISDEVSTQLIAIGLNTALSEQLSFSDAAIAQLNSLVDLEDNFTIADSASFQMTMSSDLVDAFTFVDAVNFDRASFGNINDQFTFSDEVSVALSVQIVVSLTASVSDTISIADAVSVNKPLSMTDYLRNYLNDVRLP